MHTCSLSMGRKLTPEELELRGDAHAQRAQANRYTALRVEIEKYLEEFPEDLALVQSHIRSLKRAREKHRKRGETSGAAKTAPPSADVPWLDQYTKPSACPSGLLQRLLGQANRVTFSAHNLKALLVQGQREVAKQLCAEYLEFATDIDCDAIIPPHLRHFEKMAEIVVASTQRQRLANLVLPANFDGVYIAKDERSTGKGVWLKEQYADGPWRKVPVDFGSGEKLFFTKNWSQMKSTLCMEGSMQSFQCMLLGQGRTEEIKNPLFVRKVDSSRRAASSKKQEQGVNPKGGPRSKEGKGVKGVSE